MHQLFGKFWYCKMSNQFDEPAIGGGAGKLTKYSTRCDFLGALCSLISRNSPFSVLGTSTDW